MDECSPLAHIPNPECLQLLLLLEGKLVQEHSGPGTKTFMPVAHLGISISHVKTAIGKDGL